MAKATFPGWYEVDRIWRAHYYRVGADNVVKSACGTVVIVGGGHPDPPWNHVRAGRRSFDDLRRTRHHEACKRCVALGHRRPLRRRRWFRWGRHVD